MIVKKPAPLARLFLVAVMFIGGCATGNIPMDQSKLDDIRNAKSVNVLYHGPVGPALQTAEDAVTFQFTMGIGGWGTPGVQLMQENGIEDPLVAVRDQLIERLHSDAGMTRLARADSPAPFDRTSVEDMRSLYGDGLYLQLIPGQWTIIYYVSDWSHYRMYYGVQAKLIDTRDGSVLWSSTCQANQDEGDRAPDMEQLLANKAQKIKQWADAASRQCAEQLASHFLGQNT